MKIFLRNISTKIRAFLQPDDIWLVKVLKYSVLLTVGILTLIVLYALCLIVFLGYLMAIRRFHI